MQKLKIDINWSKTVIRIYIFLDYKNNISKTG